MRNPLPLLLACATALVLLFASSAKTAAASGPVALGPGGVLDLHVKLFRAVDQRDRKGVQEILEGSRRGALIANGEWEFDGHAMRHFLPDPEGRPFVVDDEDHAAKLLLAMDGSDSKGPWKTEVVEGWMDCPSADISFATLTIERSRALGEKTEKVRYHITSLVSHTDDGWKLWHMHLSPAQ